jgi:polar amino acid transport system substrate-binding protein
MNCDGVERDRDDQTEWRRPIRGEAPAEPCVEYSLAAGGLAGASPSRCVALLTACIILVSTAAAVKVENANTKQQTNTSDRSPLIVCAVPDSMPRTGRTSDGSPQGLDVAVARLVARKLGRKLEFHWCASAACSWKCIRTGKCDIIIGQPHSSGSARELAWSIPYAGSRFGMVVHRDTTGIHTHSDLNGKRVGIVVGTLAPSKDSKIVPFKTRQLLLNDFMAKKLNAALVDDDFAAWYLHQHPKLPLRRVSEYVPRERWNMGFAVRKADKALLSEINRVLTHLLGTGTISKAFSDQGVGFRAPYSDTKLRAARYDTWQRIQEKGEIVVSMDPANLPYSSAKQDRPGFDVEVARALAVALGVKLRIDWIDVQRETAIGSLLEHECDLAFGAAIDPGAVDDEQELAGRVIYSRPYYGTGYLLVTRKDGPQAKSLTELKGRKSRRIGTEAGSVADYHLRQSGYLRRLFRTQLSVLKSLDDGGIDYGYLWVNVGWTLHTSPDFDVQLVPGYVPEDHWNIAIAMRSGDNALKRHVDAAVEKIVKAGAVSQALAGYHVPHFPPFETKPAKVAPQTDARTGQDRQSSVIRREPTDRGLEPDMQRRQRSKTIYTGLKRLRAAGELVVGLDHRNLPFSTVHPKPAGLDYEIAGLLAKQLGVPLRIYWAYSSHDSYPSKLATKKLCDVMLGVMPDDRFAKRVIYSKPYYFADYRTVALAAADVLLGQGPLAVERGVATRGIRDRIVHEYANLQSILEAIVGGQEQAGYVISTRGRWLAETRWPGKFVFLGSGSESVDRFPICAAVRKNDAELKQAIDQAFAELAKSRKLGEVFARWHIVEKSGERNAESRGK